MSDSEEESIASLVSSVYRDVWKEFQDWDHSYSAAAIESLQYDSLEDPAENTAHESTEMRTPRFFTSNWTNTSDTLHWVYPEEVVHRTDASLVPIIEYQIPRLQVPQIEPAPAYESCTPLSINTYVGDDPDTLPFVPFIGESLLDKTFEFDEYHNHYDAFSWEDRDLDPDVEMIIIETISRLDSYHDIPVSIIKRVGVLPNIRWSKLLQRDLLQWRTFPILVDAVRKTLLEDPRNSDHMESLERTINEFCPSLDCIEHYCYLHEYNSRMRPPGIISLDKTRTTSSKPCGKDCYLLVDEGTAKNTRALEIDESKSKSIAMELSVLPTLSPCQLAITNVAITCKEADAIIRYLASNESESKIQANLRESMDAVSAEDEIEIYECFNLGYEPDLPCHHSGPCDSTADCPCYHNKSYCERRCRCSPQCKRRYRGCNCKVSNGMHPKSCRNGSCPCVLAGRECDPEACGSCEMKEGYCYNSQIQRGISKRTVVKSGKHGMGLYLDETVHKGELIVEYTGELIYEATVQSREFLSSFRGRSYLFKLSDSLSIDGSMMGNESRFINHGRGKVVNCHASYHFVNGVHRIGIFATKAIKRGTELYLDYGDEFFKNSNPES